MSFERLAQALTRRASALAAARAEMRRRERREDPSRWHRPHLLWPHFTSRTD
ncbi:hypothetical protein [Qipengyuania sp. RANM35]|uniref:hypothetical protein n=1 Tax=Qipengyuania sp. RANM35 TaxID=3068635 RepID=UPI0034DAF856